MGQVGYRFATRFDEAPDFISLDTSMGHIFATPTTPWSHLSHHLVSLKIACNNVLLTFSEALTLDHI
jgi:hypothetical protein